MLQEYLQGKDHISFMYPSGIDRYRQQFECLEDKNERGVMLRRKYASLPRERVCNDDIDNIDQSNKRTAASATRATLQSPTKLQGSREPEHAKQNVLGTPEYANRNVLGTPKASGKPTQNGRRLLKSESISASRCVGVIHKPHGVHGEAQKLVA